MSKFQVFNVSLEMVERVHQLLPILKRQDNNLWDQINRASKAVPLNIAEANRRTGRDRAHRFRIAKGENDEVMAAMKVAVVCQMLSREQVEQPLVLCDRVGAMLYRLIG